MSSSPVRPGDIVAEKYRVERVLGEGGMGVVVAATHLDLLEPRALKFMSPSAAGEAEAAARFLREARAAARLKSEHIAKVYDVGRLSSGVPYMVMEHLEGSDLEALLKIHGLLPPALAALYALQVCAALAEAHSTGIVHRDLKPANLFLTCRTDGSPCIKVLDFGISKVTVPGLEGGATRTQEILGSPFYMSPEQMRSTRSVDARSDIWSLGVILYKFVTGRVPFHTKNITELVSLVLEASPAPPSILGIALPPGFEGVILRCLRRNREERYGSVVELAGDLARFAPPGAGALVEAMGRVFAGAGGGGAGRAAGSSAAALMSMESGIMAGTALGVAAGAGPTQAAAAVTPGVGGGGGGMAGAVGPAAMSAAAGGEPTTASWGKTAPRTRSRSGVGMVLGVLGGVMVLGAAAVIGVMVWLRGAARSEEGGSKALATVEPVVSARATAAAAAAAVVSAAPLVTVVPSMPAVTAAAPAAAVSVAVSSHAVGSAAAPEGSAKKKSVPDGGQKAAPGGENLLGGKPVF